VGQDRQRRRWRLAIGLGGLAALALGAWTLGFSLRSYLIILDTRVHGSDSIWWARFALAGSWLLHGLLCWTYLFLGARIAWVRSTALASSYLIIGLAAYGVWKVLEETQRLRFSHVTVWGVLAYVCLLCSGIVVPLHLRSGAGRAREETPADST
jgi:hypothetical protein